jgi:hypothetical protein
MYYCFVCIYVCMYVFEKEENENVVSNGRLSLKILNDFAYVAPTFRFYIWCQKFKRRERCSTSLAGSVLK